MTRIPNLKALVNSLSPAYAAALALIAIQVSIGLLYKASQTNGKYGFSASSSVTISESLKFLLSSYFFYREWRKRGYAPVPDEPLMEVKLEEVEEGKGRNDGGESSSDTLSLDDEDYASNSEGMQKTSRHSRFPLKSFLGSCKEELPIEVRYGFVHLALFYVLINNTVFVLFRMADPGTIQLIKSGTTFITAIVMILSLGTKISGAHWIAIALQVCGIIVTQYSPNGTANYPISTYILLLFQTTLSSISSVYNQKLCKSHDGSLHVMNMTLYASGACTNLVLHILIRIINKEEPGFFTGYVNIGAVMVIISNVFIGLAMTAVYKYADALIKCFATAISTGLLLYISPLLFNVNFSFLVVPGTCVVFLATWLYMDATPKPTTETTMMPATVEERSCIARMTHALSPHGTFRRVGLVMSTSMAFMLVGMLTYWRTHMIPTEPAVTAPIPDLEINNSTLTNMTMQGAAAQVPVFESAFKNTMAFIRINHDLPERVETLTEGYAPYFHTLHFSMPGDGHNVTESNATRDFWWDPQLVYPPVISTVQLLMDDPAYAEVEGLLYYHFDSWIEPLSFHDMDFERIWVLDNSDGPPFICMKDTKDYDPDWQWFQMGKHDEAKSAMRIAKKFLGGFEIDPDEFCVGWSDMYYLPRRFFRDYMQLASVFASVSVFHEVGIPTIFNIIDRTHRPHPSYSVLARWGDCWGSCCADNVRPADIRRSRCGHKLNYLDWPVAVTHYDRLADNSRLLGQELPVKAFGDGGGGGRGPKLFGPKTKPKLAEGGGGEADATTAVAAAAAEGEVDDPAERLRFLLMI